MKEFQKKRVDLFWTFENDDIVFIVEIYLKMWTQKACHNNIKI